MSFITYLETGVLCEGKKKMDFFFDGKYLSSSNREGSLKQAKEEFLSDLGADKFLKDPTYTHESLKNKMASLKDKIIANPEKLKVVFSESKWSGEVETKWEPKEGFFKQSAEKIASGLKSASKDLKQAMSRLNFYINRSGSNLSPEDKARLENAKGKLEKLYA